MQAAVPYYGAYDLTDPARMCDLMLPFLERFVMRASLADLPGLFRAASPVAYAELPNAHHAFDTVATVRSQLAADAVADFLGVSYGQYCSRSGVRRRTAAAV